MQANEVLKIVSGSGKVLTGKMLIYNAFTNQTSYIKIVRDEKNFDKDTLMKSFAN